MPNMTQLEGTAPRTSAELLYSPRYRKKGQESSSTSIVKQIYDGGLLSVLSESAIGFSVDRGRCTTLRPSRKPKLVKPTAIDSNPVCFEHQPTGDS